MRAGERAELEKMRDQMVTRMSDLQDQVDAGTLTDQERYDALKQEFGEHYHKTLNEINDLLSGTEPRTHLLDTKLPAFVGILLALAVAVTMIVGTSPTGAAINDARTTKLDVALANGQASKLALPQQITIKNLEVTSAAEQYTLRLEDATGVHTLRTQDACTGCGEQYRAPYLLSAQTDGAVQVTSISYEVHE